WAALCADGHDAPNAHHHTDRPVQKTYLSVLERHPDLARYCQYFACSPALAFLKLVLAWIRHRGFQSFIVYTVTIVRRVLQKIVELEVAIFPEAAVAAG